MNSKYSILLVGTFLSNAGYSRSACEDFSSHLTKAGWIVIQTSSKDSRLARLIDMVMTTWLTRKTYVIAQVDVFSGLAFIWAELVCWLLQLMQKPTILTLHGGDLPKFARRWPRRVHRLLTKAQVVTAPSFYLLKEMQPYRSDLVLLPNAIDSGKYIFFPRLVPKPRIVWLRAFHEIYNPSLAPKALAKVVENFPEARLIMIGPDKGDGSLVKTQAVAIEMGIGDRITYTGRIPKEEVPDYLNQSDIFLNTTNVDNTPVSVLEALACGLCTVSTNVGGIPHLLKDENDALLVPPNDPDAMATAIIRILSEPALAERISRCGRRKVTQMDWSVILPKWEELIQETLDNV